MGYLNPVLHRGPAAFARDCAAAGVAGVIVPDLPLDEAAGLRRVLGPVDVDLISLVAPTTDEARLRRHAESAAGFLYLVSTTGVTGAGAGAGDELEAYADRVRAVCALPLYVGFGVGTPAQAARVAGCADGAIVGSALLRRLADAADPDAARTAAATFVTDLYRSMNPEADAPVKGDRS